MRGVSEWEGEESECEWEWEGGESECSDCSE